jgi:hypothetical protein
VDSDLCRLGACKFVEPKSAFGTKKIVITCSTLSLSHTLVTATAFHNLFLVFFFLNTKLKKINNFSFLGLIHDKAFSHVSSVT